jgi:hypothetical protein
MLAQPSSHNPPRGFRNHSTHRRLIPSFAFSSLNRPNCLFYGLLELYMLQDATECYTFIISRARQTAQLHTPPLRACVRS